MTVFKKFAVGALMTSMLVPALAFAQTTTPSALQTLLDQIKALQAQIVALQQQQQPLIQQQQANMVSLIRTLRQGATGEDVAALQALLAADPSIYPEGTISGFFGKLTAQAVKRFQNRHGLEQVGDVGPKTLKKLNEFLREHPMGWQTGTSTIATSSNRGQGEAHRPCAIVPPGHLIAPGWLRKHSDDDKPVVPLCQTLPKGIWDKMDDDEDDEDHGTTTRDRIAPVISSVSATSLTTTGATIQWTTNENSTSQVEYGISTAYGSTTPINFTLVGSHSVNLTSLLASTLYHFRVYSRDAANNLATSSDMTFTTVTPDTTAPAISGISVAPIASTTATVSWTTNENATGKVYYATTSPVNLGTALTMGSASLTLGHSFGLTGLTASTTYYYVLESIDASSNTATTSTASFVTTI